MASGGLPHQPLPAAAFLAHFGKDSLGHSNAGPLDSRGPVAAALPQIEIHPRHIVPDERDAFISWLRGEFAAANAIIDAMCHHLCMVGEPSEYDFVFTCIQQRRYNWTLVLHMQQFFSVAEVICALQQATWRKQQVRSANQPLMQQTVHRSMEEFKDTQTPNILRGLKGEARGLFPQPEGSVPEVSASMNRDLSPDDSSLSQEVSSSKGTQTPVPRVDDLGASQSLPRSGLDSIEQSTDLVFPDLARRMISESSEGQEAHTDAEKEGYTALSKSPGSYGGKLFNADLTALSKEEQDARLRMVKVSKHFQCWEHVEGNLINVAEGLELYENVLNNYETSQLAYLITEIQAAGRRGELRGKTFVVDKRITGSPKETIQFGHSNNNPPGELTEPMPVILNTVIDRLIQWHVLPASKRPDYCSVKVLEEGEESPLFVHHQRLDQYFCCFFLMDECTLVMGHNLSMDNGDHKNRFKLLLPSGSALLLQGNSADVASRAVLASPGRRIIVTFGKFLGSKVSDVYPLGGKFVHSAPTNTAPISTATAWLPVGLHGGAAGVHGIVPAAVKHYGMATAPGVLPIPSVRPLLHSPHHFPQHLAATPGSVQAVITSPTGPARVYPPLGVMSQGWSAVPPRAPRPPNNGTGVFFPSSGSSGGSPGQPLGPSQIQAGVIMVSQLSQKPEPLVAFAPSTTDSSNNFGCPPSRVLRSSMLTDQSDHLVERPESFSSFNSLGSNEPILPRKATCKEPANPGLKSEANSNNRNIKEEQLQQQRVFHPSNKAGGGKI